MTGAGGLPNTIAPSVVEINSVGLAGADPSTNPIVANDVIVVRFDEPMDASSLDLVENIVVRNLSVTTPSSPGGVRIPVTMSLNATNEVMLLTPQPGFGPGPFQIEVSIGAGGGALLDLPSGLSRLSFP